MKPYIFILTIFSLLLATGCMNSPLAFRSVLYMNQQQVTTNGTLESAPTFGSANVEAPKTTSDSFQAKTDANANVGNTAGTLSNTAAGTGTNNTPTTETK